MAIDPDVQVLLDDINARIDALQCGVSVLDYPTPQEAIDASSGIVYWPAGDYYVPGGLIANRDGLSFVGAGREVSRIWTDAADLFTIEGMHLTFRDLKLEASNGHVFSQSGGVGRSHFHDLRAIQHSDDKSVWTNNDHGYIDNNWSNFDSQHTQSASVPSFRFVSSNGSVNVNQWSRFRHTYSGEYVFHIESTASATYAYDNRITHANFEVCSGGMVRLVGNYSPKLDQLALYDTPTLLKHGVVLDAQTVDSRDGVLMSVVRRGGTLDSGVADLFIDGIATTLNHVVINCGTPAGSYQIEANGRRFALLPGSNVAVANGDNVRPLTTLRSSTLDAIGGDL